MRLFRRSRVVGLAGALILAAAAIGIGVAVTTGSGGSITVAPDSVAVLDTDGRLVGDVPIGGRPVSIALGDDAGWVANADDGTVLRIDRDSHEVVETIGLGADVNSVDVGFGSIWVAGGNSETLFRIDPDENAVEATLRIGKGDPLRPEPVFFVAAGRQAVWITQGSAVLRVDPATNQVTKRVALPSSPTDLAAGGGNVWATLSDESLVRIDEGSAAISATAPLPGFPGSPVFEAGALWLIVFTETAQVSKIDPSSLAQSASASFPSTRPGFLADLGAAEGVVWTADNESGAVWRIGAATLLARRVATVGYHPISVAAEAHATWVGVQENAFSY